MTGVTSHGATGSRRGVGAAPPGGHAGPPRVHRAPARHQFTLLGLLGELQHGRLCQTLSHATIKRDKVACSGGRNAPRRAEEISLTTRTDFSKVQRAYLTTIYVGRASTASIRRRRRGCHGAAEPSGEMGGHAGAGSSACPVQCRRAGPNCRFHFISASIRRDAFLRPAEEALARTAPLAATPRAAPSECMPLPADPPPPLPCVPGTKRKGCCRQGPLGPAPPQ